LARRGGVLLRGARLFKRGPPVGGWARGDKKVGASAKHDDHAGGEKSKTH
jgi:hypothetical protein